MSLHSGIQEGRENEKVGQALGVRWMSVPNKRATSSERKLLQHQRGLRRCLYPGLDGMRRWLGLGVIADNVIQMGCYLARQST